MMTCGTGWWLQERWNLTRRWEIGGQLDLQEGEDDLVRLAPWSAYTDQQDSLQDDYSMMNAGTGVLLP